MVTAQLASGSGLLCGLYKQRQVAELPDIGENFFSFREGRKDKETRDKGNWRRLLGGKRKQRCWPLRFL